MVWGKRWFLTNELRKNNMQYYKAFKTSIIRYLYMSTSSAKYKVK